MIQAGERALITLTLAAAEKLAGIMDQKGVRETHALRVYIAGIGCSGLQYGMAFDGAPREVDTVFEQQGLRVVVDPQSAPYLAGASIDYVDGPLGGRFHIENPNAVSSCSASGCQSCQ
jgi:iron-sulfur cluster assembly protein